MIGDQIDPESGFPRHQRMNEVESQCIMQYAAPRMFHKQVLYITPPPSLLPTIAIRFKFDPTTHPITGKNPLPIASPNSRITAIFTAPTRRTCPTVLTISAGIASTRQAPSARNAALSNSPSLSETPCPAGIPGVSAALSVGEGEREAGGDEERNGETWR